MIHAQQITIKITGEHQISKIRTDVKKTDANFEISAPNIPQNISKSLGIKLCFDQCFKLLITAYKKNPA